jgi:hypothetical protein
MQFSGTPEWKEPGSLSNYLVSNVSNIGMTAYKWMFRTRRPDKVVEEWIQIQKVSEDWAWATTQFKGKEESLN